MEKNTVSLSPVPAPGPPHGLRMWQSVKIKTKGHPRHGQAGTAKQLFGGDQSHIGVEFDLLRQGAEIVNAADLQMLR